MKKKQCGSACVRKCVSEEQERSVVVPECGSAGVKMEKCGSAEVRKCVSEEREKWDM